ncbi:MAG: N-(5'-phosphoribosyl)anthranilate isomerase [Gammaproteobacteria bacterium]|nr:MAG: N-(5'-phosphoribosyl)anthranilate isomerase [Gammaproteobacteria bacterium]
MSLLIKICGITTEEGVDAAVAAGADAIGFVFHASSPRDLAPARAAALADSVPVLRFAVTRHPSQELVDQILAVFQPDAWQTDTADFQHLRVPAAIECWPVLRSGSVLPQLLPERMLFDAARSGAGERADWAVAAGLARRCSLILAGGLDSGNVGEAIARVRPGGVDVSSGVERAPGIKDPTMIRDFVRAARAAMAG